MKRWMLVVVVLVGLGVGRAQETLVVPMGMPVAVKLLEQLSSTESKAGSPVKMEAALDVVVDGRVVVRKGAPLSAVLVNVEKKAKTVARGKVTLRLLNVSMVNGEKLELGDQRTAVGGHMNKSVYQTLIYGSMALLSAAGGAASVLVRGDEIVMPEGTVFEAFTAADTRVKTAGLPEGVAVAVLTQTETPTVKVSVATSAGDGSVRVDKRYLGEAPLTLELKEGIHMVTVDRDGYKSWEEKVVVSGGPEMLKVEMKKK